MKKEACPICESVYITKLIGGPLFELPLYKCGFCHERFDIPIFIEMNEETPIKKLTASEK